MASTLAQSPDGGVTRAAAPAVAAAAHDQPAKPKKLHGRAFYESIGSPKFIVAPMVDQSEFAWRMLSRSFLPESQRSSVLAYSPMLHARLFLDSQKYRDSHFEPTRPFPAPPTDATTTPLQPYLDGNPAIDRPLFVQFCANDPDTLLSAAQLVAPYCDAVDLNFGCPQGIARRGHYGAFLQEDQELIYRLVNILHENLAIPVTAKIRILETREATLAYARNVLAAGASILTVHGRRREQKGHLTGLADWDTIRYLRENLPPETVLFANGNILQPGDIENCLRATGADGVMSAEGNLSDPGIFGPVPEPGQEGREYWRGRDGRGGWRVDAVMRRYLDILYKYTLSENPPPRRPLFVPGDDTAWLEVATTTAAEAEAADEADEADEEEGPARKKRKRDKARKKKYKKTKSNDNNGGDNKHNELTATSPNFIAVQAHLFHLLRHFISRHHDVRDALARSTKGDMPEYERILGIIERKVAEGLLEYERTDGKSVEEDEGEKKDSERDDRPSTADQQNGAEAIEAAAEAEDPDSSVHTVKRCKRPWWVAQPIVRPLPKEALAKGAISLGKKDKLKLDKEEEAAQDQGQHQDHDRADPGSEGGGRTPPPKGTGGGADASLLERSTSFPRSELVSG